MVEDGSRLEADYQRALCTLVKIRDFGAHGLLWVAEGKVAVAETGRGDQRRMMSGKRCDELVGWWTATAT